MSSGCSNCIYFRTVNFTCFPGLFLCHKLQPKKQQVLFHSCFQGLTPKTKRIIFITKFKKTNKTQTNTKKEKKRKNPTHQLLAVIADTTLNTLGSMTKRVSEASSWLSCVPNMNWSLTSLSFCAKLSCELKRNSLWIITSWPLLLPGRISAPLSRGAWQIGLLYRFWFLMPLVLCRTGL